MPSKCAGQEFSRKLRNAQVQINGQGINKRKKWPIRSKRPHKLLINAQAIFFLKNIKNEHFVYLAHQTTYKLRPTKKSGFFFFWIFSGFFSRFFYVVKMKKKIQKKNCKKKCWEKNPKKIPAFFLGFFSNFFFHFYYWKKSRKNPKKKSKKKSRFFSDFFRWTHL